MLKNMKNIHITLITMIILIRMSSTWTHYEQSYKGSCDVANEKSCKDLGEHAYRGDILDEPPKGPRFYMEDLEPFHEDYSINERKKRASKKKESKAVPNESKAHKDYDEEDEDDEEEEVEEEKSEKPVKKSSERKKGKKKKTEDDVENNEDEEEEEDDEAEGNEDESDDSGNGDEIVKGNGHR